MREFLTGKMVIGASDTVKVHVSVISLYHLHNMNLQAICSVLCWRELEVITLSLGLSL